jgi:hypothetical protein
MGKLIMRRKIESTLDEDQTFETLQNTTFLSNRLSIPYGKMKPCIARLYANALSKGSYPNRNSGALIIATELRRLEKEKDDVLFLLKEWNQKNEPPLKISQIEKAVKSAFHKKENGEYRYNYTCNNPFLAINCIGEYCQIGKSFEKRRKYNNNRQFLDYSWQNILSNKAKDIYYIAIPELERRLGVGAGGILFASHRRIAHFAGVSRKGLKKSLLKLKEVGLLARCEIGTSRKWERKATIIQRKIPIPRPSK